ncbi:MAG: aconitate hydratase, partial [Nannocystaceae bacterium]
APNDGLPVNGFEPGLAGFDTPAAEAEADAVEVRIDPSSKRLEVLEPFAAWDGNDYNDLPVLLKAKGKCTTDHISPAGKWLKFRGHLNNISDNMFIGAVNWFSDEPGTGLNVFTGEKNINLSKLARTYKAQGIGWVSIGDGNYGEGSSREHAAMSPRLLGAKFVVARSFARIHETNLKKQGVIAATFADPADYEKVQAEDRISLRGLAELAPRKPLTVVLTHKDGSMDRFDVNHTLNEEQIEWFKAGSALNAFANSKAQAAN